MHVYDVTPYGNMVQFNSGLPLNASETTSSSWQSPFTKEEQEKLVCEAPVDIIDILPTGEVYVTQLEYRKKLNEIFGVGEWGMEPASAYFEGEQARRQCWKLVIRGRVVSYAWGEDEVYASDRAKASYAAPEIAKSNALPRLTKDFLLFHNLWDRKFIEEFKNKYCEVSFRNNPKSGRQEEQWKLKGSKTSPQPSPAVVELKRDNGDTNNVPTPGKSIIATLMECSIPGEKGKKSGRALWDISGYGKLETSFFDPPRGLDSFEELKALIGKEVSFIYRQNGKWNNLMEVQGNVSVNEDLIAAREEVAKLITQTAKEWGKEEIVLWNSWGKVGKEDLHTLEECSHIVWDIEKSYGDNN